MYQVAVVGSGPAGLSAAVWLRMRDKTVLLLSNSVEENPLWRSERVDNYLGLPGLTGNELLTKFKDHAKLLGVEAVPGRVLSIMPMGDRFMLSYGSEVAEAQAVILATGVARGKKVPGEAEFLGRGVSYCATCDGMLYRKRRVVVTGNAKDVVEEASFLHEIGCIVTFVGDKRPDGLPEEIPFVSAKNLEIVGAESLTGLRADDTLIPCEGVFLLRNAVAAEDMLAGLEMDGNSIQVSRDMETSIPGVYAAGDCTGQPHQIAKAVGEGQIAAMKAVEWIRENG
jgi:thioredoxin reductase (NADPH)